MKIQDATRLKRAILLGARVANNPTLYLTRGYANFELGNYAAANADYSQFLEKTNASFSVTDFSIGFAKGLPQGVYDSGKSSLLFLSDFIGHPIQTSKQVFDSLTQLAVLIKNDEFGVVAEVLSPELHQLVVQWDTLPSETRGELAGYAVGKLGTDLLAPGAAAKIASQSISSAKELVAICKNLQIAQEALVLETAAGIGVPVKIAEVVQNGQTVAFLGEELGFTAQEIGQLKKVGKLEQTIDSACESWLAKSPSEAYLAAKNGGKHADLIPKFSEKPIKEIEKSIRSYEKLITEHQDKIANPLKHYPHWNTLDPRRQDALINKRWPAEIQCYTEQKDVLQTLLDQRK